MSNHRRTLLLGLATCILATMFGYQSYQYRCVVFACEPLTWTEMQALARTYAATAGPGYRIEVVFAKPASGTTSTAAGPATLQISMHFVAPEPYEIMGTQAMYRVRAITVVDRDRVVRWSPGNQSTSQRPSHESQQRLNQVRIGPREVYHLTWDRAQRDLAESVRLDSIMVLTLEDQAPESLQPDVSWYIHYFGERGTIAYRVDAQTGTIIEDDGSG